MKVNLITTIIIEFANNTHLGDRMIFPTSMIKFNWWGVSYLWNLIRPHVVSFRYLLYVGGRFIFYSLTHMLIVLCKNHSRCPSRSRIVFKFNDNKSSHGWREFLKVQISTSCFHLPISSLLPFIIIAQHCTTCVPLCTYDIIINMYI